MNSRERDIFALAMGKVWQIIDGVKPPMMMMTVQIVLTGVSILLKIAGSNGFSLPVLVAYRFLFASATVVPLALIFERKSRPRLTWKVLLQAFGCALFGGTLAQNLYAKSLVLTSATFAAAIANLNPAITFILAIIFRMEALGLKTKAGKAKLLGTFLGIGGAMLLTFYKGLEVNIFSTHIDLLHKSGASSAGSHDSKNNILGLVLAVVCCCSISLSLIGQAKMSASYPCHYSSTALIAVMGSIQGVVFALCVERDWNQWKLGWDLKLLTVIFMGIFASGITWVFIMACVKMKGPLYISVFNPVLLVLVAITGSLFLNEKLHLGSVLGAVVIICGLYLVLWGKSKEMKKMKSLVQPKNIGDAMVDETATESFNSFNHAHNIVLVTPNFVSQCELLEVSQNDEEEEEDLESNKQERS